MKKEGTHQNISVEKNDQSEVTITASISEESALEYRPRALKKLGENVELPGFRKGHVPENMLVERIGEQTLLEEMAEMAIADAYPRIIEEQKLAVVGRPSVSITKLAVGNPIEFKIEAALEPEITLPDYKALAKEVLSVPDIIEVNDSEVNDVLFNLRKNKWQIDNKEKVEKGEQPKDDELPELTDELIQGLGDFKDLEDFKIKLRKNIEEEKTRKAKEKRRIEVSDKIIEGAEIPLPRILVEGELEGMFGQLKSDLKRNGMELEDYLKQIGKTIEQLREEWKANAEKRAKLQLVLNEIAKKENIIPEEEQVKKEVAHLKEHMKDADEMRIKIYVMTVLQNEEVFKFLEKQGEKTV